MKGRNGRSLDIALVVRPAPGQGRYEVSLDQPAIGSGLF
jgi:hypothetical protein